MTGNCDAKDAADAGESQRAVPDGTRQACIETQHDDADVARQVARSIAPDNTAEMATRSEGSTVVTRIGRDTTGGLDANVDDYIKNLTLAAQLLTRDREPSTVSPEGENASTRQNGSPTDNT